MTNFYIISGNVERIDAYFQKLNYERLQSASEENHGYTVVSTDRKFYWHIQAHWLDEVKNKIKIQAREKSTQISFQHFRRLYELNNSIITN